MKNKVYGYARVSGKDQNEDRQIIALIEHGVHKRNIFIDKQSGKDFERPEYRKLVKILRPGDTLILTSIDRLGRNYEEVLNQWQLLTKEKCVDIAILDMPLLDTRRGKDLLGTFISDLVLSLLSYVAENERNNIRKRQAEGIDAAKSRGVQFGRPEKEVTDSFAAAYADWRIGNLTLRDAACNAGMPTSTFYNKCVKLMRQRAGIDDE